MSPRHCRADTSDAMIDTFHELGFIGSMIAACNTLGTTLHFKLEGDKFSAYDWAQKGQFAKPSLIDDLKTRHHP